MRLKYIKLAGFKSFVDVTKVSFPEQMTCVVGPNGCGKSNVIDAVRWVLGESSAKNLRGDAMTDVIFNGSTARQAISQASVELVFDNCSGRMGGEFAQYQEVSVKRQVHRDGQSLYFLNGTKCRRRDITDLFLGTGLGPRSYAIIEQGMISRLIESKPQELRVFIEEAAGISKYKERRRETENRMNRTRDNLDRLSDVREELGKQLNKLERQAAAAQKYQTLKTDERRLKSELQAFRWLQYQAQCDQLALVLQAEEAKLEKWVAEQRGTERGQHTLRESLQEAQVAVEQAQTAFYENTNQVTRYEQQLNHLLQMNQQRTRQLEQLKAKKLQVGQELLDEQAQLEFQLEETAVLKEQFSEADIALEIAQEAAVEADKTQQDWQEKWQGLQAKKAELARAYSVKQAEQQAKQAMLVQLSSNLERVDEELASFSVDANNALEELKQEKERLTQGMEVKQAEAEHHKNTLTLLEQQHQAHVQEIAQAQSELHLLEGELKSLTVLIQNHSEQPTIPSVDETAWLSAQCSLGQLHTLLTVPEPFQQALEALIKPWLSAWVLAKQPANWPDYLQSAYLILSENKPKAEAPALRALLNSEVAGLFLWDRVAVAQSEHEAQVLLNSGDWETVLLPAGRIIGTHWYLSERPNLPSLLYWQKQKNELVQRQAQEKLSLQQLRSLQQQQAEQMTELKQIYEASSVLLQQTVLAKTRAEERYLNAELERQKGIERQQQLTLEQQNLAQKLLAHKTELRVLIKEIEILKPQIIEEQPEFEQMQQTGEQIKAAQVQAQQKVQSYQQALHQCQLALQKGESQQHYVEKNIQRLETQKSQIEDEINSLSIQEEDIDTRALLEEALAEALLEREAKEEKLTEEKEKLAVLQIQMADLHQGQSIVIAQIEQQRAVVESHRLTLATSRERGHALLESFDEMKVSLKEVLASMPEEVEEKTWQEQLQTCQRKLSQLGAINLAALEEVKIQQARKTHLDTQHEDLIASLETLEAAIRKIDRETKTKFKETFEQVNQDLQSLFPKVFSGGSAYLELTDSDLLETGVTIMARPPGKKNSTIHLLSGGEKALTALALVFAIFRLNPAPFCLLDEVDAPLDDVNVGRFCRLVQEMSESVQFIYISHNKVAMEMASHLVGVTMQEPGVSRLVAVDVDEALALSEAL